MKNSTLNTVFLSIGAFATTNGGFYSNQPPLKKQHQQSLLMGVL
jgi:hypothetical protein